MRPYYVPICSIVSVTMCFVATVASVKGIEGIAWSGSRGLMSKVVRPEEQGNVSCTKFSGPYLFMHSLAGHETGDKTFRL